MSALPRSFLPSNRLAEVSLLIDTSIDCFSGTKAVEGGAFELVSLGGLLGNEDFDIAFYASFTPTVATATIMNRAVGGESGTIPDGSRFAVITLFDGANAAFAFRAWEPVDSTERSKGLAPPALPATPGISPEFGFDGDRVKQRAKKLRSRSHVVIAVVDTGINPYHVAYRRPEYAIHPSNYIEGFPADAPALGLSFGAGSYEAARSTDDGPVWSQVSEKKLWASEQPWIDFVSGSYGDPAAIPCNDAVDDMGVWCGREYRYTAPFVLRDARTACFSAGNGLTRIGVLADRYSSLRPTSGPSWVITVGAVSPRNEQD